MILSLRNIKLRMRSVESTRKITRAMEMISAAKLNRVKQELYATRLYFKKLEEMARRLLSDAESPHYALLDKREVVKNTVLCVITSDAGLCGTYNQALIRATEDFAKNYDAGTLQLVVAGKEGYSHFKRRPFPIKGVYLDMHGRYSQKISDLIDSSLIDMFLKKEADEVYIAYTRFDATLRHKPVVEKFLNIEYEKKASIDYIIEPDMARVLDELIPRYMREKLRAAFFESFTSEHSARMVAMKMATDNADELLENLTLARNKARQASITKEIIEIISSAEALKG